MYWITRLTAMQNFFMAIFVISIMATIIIGAFLLATCDDSGAKEPDYHRSVKKAFVIGIFLAISGGLGSTFIPTTSEGLLIYGVGTTIDYIDNNDTIKQLPDKAVQALDKYLDSLNKDNENENSHN